MRIYSRRNNSPLIVRITKMKLNINLAFLMILERVKAEVSKLE